MSDSGSPISICVKLNSSKGEKSVVVKSSTFFIGRGHDCTIRIDNSGISRTHVEVSYEDGILYVADQGSSNGTFLNGTKLTGFQRVSTNPTDKIALGRSDITLNVWVEQKVSLHGQPTARTTQHTSPQIPQPPVAPQIPIIPLEPVKLADPVPFVPPPIPPELVAAAEAEEKDFEFKISRENEPSIRKIEEPIKLEESIKLNTALRTEAPKKFKLDLDAGAGVGQSVKQSLESKEMLQKAQEVLDRAIEQQSEILMKAQMKVQELEDNALASQKHVIAAAQQQGQNIIEEAKKQKAQMISDMRAKELQVLEEAKKKEAKIIEEAKGKEAVLHEEFRKREAMMMEDLKKKEVQFINNAKQKEVDLLTRAQKKADEIILNAQRKASDIEESTQGQLLEMKAHAETQIRERMEQLRADADALKEKSQREAETIKAKALKEADQIRIKSENDADDLLERTKQEALEQAENELKTSAAALREQKSSLEGEVKVMSGTAEKLRAETMQLTKDNRVLNQERQSLSSELAIIKRDLDGLSSQRNEAFEEMHKREMFKSELEITIAELLQKKDSVNDELSNVRQRLTVETGKLDARRKEFSEFETQSKESTTRYKADLEDLVTKKEEIENRIKAATQTVLGLEKKKLTLSDEIAQRNQQFEEMTKKQDAAHQERMNAQNAAYEELSRKQDASYAEQVRRQNQAHEKLVKEQTGHLAEEAQRLESKIRVLTTTHEEQVKKQTAQFEEMLAKQNAIHRELVETQTKEYNELVKRNKADIEKVTREHDDLVKKQQASFERMVQEQQTRFGEQLTAEQEKNEDTVRIHQNQIAQLQRLERSLSSEVEQLKQKKEKITSELKEVETKGASTKTELTAVSESHQKAMRDLEKELKDARQAAASELALLKTQYEEKMNEMKADEKEKLAGLRTQVARDLMRQQDNLANDIHQKIWSSIAKEVSPDVYQAKGPETLDYIKRAISQRLTGDDGEEVAPMEFAQTIQRRANQRQWKFITMGFIGACLLVLGFQYLTSSGKEEMASDGNPPPKEAPQKHVEPPKPVVQQKPPAKPEDDKPIRRFRPMQDNEMRDSYTEAVLYTKDFERVFLDSEVQDRWLKEAVDHLSKRLKIDEAKTVEAIAISRTLVSTLQRMKQEIHADFVNQSVSKMNELENNAVNRMTSLFGERKRYDIFKKFEKRFFATELSGQGSGRKTPASVKSSSKKKEAKQVEDDDLFE